MVDPTQEAGGRYSRDWKSGDAIFDVVQRAEAPLSVDDVLHRLFQDGFESDWKIPYESVKTALRRLTDSGRLVKAGRGRWAAAESPELPRLELENVGGPTRGGGAT